MEDRGIRKRKLTEEAHSTQSAPSANVDSSSLSSEPGPATSLSKKKKLSESNQDMIDGDHENDTSQSPSAIEDNLLSYQKNVIWNQMQECKKQYLSAQEQVQQLLDKQVEHEAHLSTVDIYWNKLLQDIGMLMIRVDINTEVESLALPVADTSVASFMLHGSTGYNQNHETNKFTMETIKATMTARSEHTKEIVNELLRMVANWKNERNSFWSELGNADSATRESRLIEWLSQENDKVTGLQRKGMKDIEKMQAKYHSISDQIVRLRNELEMAKARLEETAESLDESKEKLRRTEKSVDRGKSSIVAAVTSGEIFGENYNGTPDTTIPSLGHMNTKNEAHDGSQDELLQYRELAVARLAELEDMKTQRIQLKNELELLKIQLKHIPDGKIQETPHVKSLLAQLQYARNDAEGYRNESNKIKADLEELYHSRRKFMEDLETEEKGRRAGLEDELKKLESEISRLRDSRDRFQQMYEARCTKDDYEMQQNQEIRKIANTRKDRITTLTTDIHRLQIMLAASTGDRDAFTFYLSGPTDKSFLDDLRNKLRTLEEQIKCVVPELEAFNQADSAVHELKKAILSEYQAKARIKVLTAELVKIEGLIGSNTENPTNALKAAIKARDQTIHLLEQNVQAHEAVQAPLLNELQDVATAWGQLEEATSRKVIELAQKEDLIYKLLSDKTRQESKCNLLIRAKDASANMTAVMKRQSDMQLDQIRKLEEREKNLNMQMATLEREQTLLNSSVALHKTKLQEYTQQNAGFKEKYARQEERLNELQNMIKERTEAYENEAHARRRLAEETEAMKRKLEEQAKVESSSGENSEAAKQAARYLKLLKCPACDLNFKSHVILRCMHVFCKPCMDNQLEFRQRKCPTCRENFGAKDVKEIYL